MDRTRRIRLRVHAAAILFLIVAGCATDGTDKDRYLRDGVRYGTTEDRFRGRWWNYYERGRSFQDGRFFAESESDLRTALNGRSRDQLWVRTYGLHLVREYFPNRELGVTLFHQNRMEEAIGFLETSLEQRFSARAAYFLDEARAGWVAAANADRSAPTLEIIAPASFESLYEMETEFVAIARDDTFVRSISIAGQPYPIDVSASEIEVRHTIRLSAGVNRVPISVTDIAGREYTVELVLTTDLDGPAVSFDDPIVLPGVIRGVAYDPAGISALNISGRAASIVDAGEGMVSFEANLAASDLSPPVRFECRDTLGNVTRGEVPLGTVVVSGALSGVVFASSTQRIPVGNDLEAILVGGHVVALTLAAAGADDATIEFTNLREGMHFLKDEIIVAMKVSAPSAIESLEVNGNPVHTLSGRRRLQVSRRIRLEEEGENAIVATLRDSQGAVGEARVTVAREYTELEGPRGRLSLALIGTHWTGSSPVQEGWSGFLEDELSRTLNEGKRFTVLSRDALPSVLAEQELSVLTSDKKSRVQLGQITAAELLVIGTLRGNEEDLEIIFQLVDSRTGETMAYADASGPARSEDDLLDLVDDLALRFEQEFPRVSGQIIDVLSSRKLLSDLSSQRLRVNMRCIVFRLEERIHPETGEYLGSQQHVLAEGTLAAVQERMSTILLDEGAEGDAPALVEVLDFVITK